MTYIAPAREIAFEDGPGLDAFGNQRVVMPSPISSLIQLNDKLNLLYDEVDDGLGGSSAVYSKPVTTMAVSGVNDYIIRQTFERHAYKAGQSQYIGCTFAGFQVQANVVKRVGYYSSTTVAPYNANRDGIWLESDGTNINAVIGKNGTEESVPQSSWNLDKMDGTGASGITVDWSKSQILVIDLQFLGVGRVRVGLDIDGILYYVHEFLHANDITGVYMLSPNQPIRFEVRGTGAGGGSMIQVCAGVKTEGSNDVYGYPFSIDNGNTSVGAALAGTTYAICGLRLTSTQLDGIPIPTRIEAFAETADDFYWQLLLNPTLSAGLTWGAISDTPLEEGVGDGTQTVTGIGYQLDSGYGTGSGGRQQTQDLRRKPGSSIDGTADQIVLAVTPKSPGLDISGVIAGVIQT